MRLKKRSIIHPNHKCTGGFKRCRTGSSSEGGGVETHPWAGDTVQQIATITAAVFNTYLRILSGRKGAEVCIWMNVIRSGKHQQSNRQHTTACVRDDKHVYSTGCACINTAFSIGRFTKRAIRQLQTLANPHIASKHSLTASLCHIFQCSCLYQTVCEWQLPWTSADIGRTSW